MGLNSLTQSSRQSIAWAAAGGDLPMLAWAAGASEWLRLRLRLHSVAA
eukprot:COSAG01_NODE_29863_length_628_cov_0.557656_1_plen_47_part_01